MTDNDSEKLLSTAKFNTVIGLVLLWGFFVNWLIVIYINPTDVLAVVNGFVILVVYTFLCGYGNYLFITSNRPWQSFLGYNLVVLPFGFSLSIVTHDAAPELLAFAFGIAIVLTLIMMVSAYFFSSFFQKIYGIATILLLSLIVIEVGQTVFFGIEQNPMNWLFVGIFCVYIGYDWSLANSVPKTLDNAIDCAAVLYMDIIALTIRIIIFLAELASNKQK